MTKWDTGRHFRCRRCHRFLPWEERTAGDVCRDCRREESRQSALGMPLLIGVLTLLLILGCSDREPGHSLGAATEDTTLMKPWSRGVSLLVESKNAVYLRRKGKFCSVSRDWETAMFPWIFLDTKDTLWIQGPVRIPGGIRTYTEEVVDATKHPTMLAIYRNERR